MPAARRRHDGGGDPLAPLGVVEADDGAVGDRRMGAQDLLDLQRRHLLAAGLDDVDRRPAEQAVAVGLAHGDVAGAEPAVA